MGLSNIGALNKVESSQKHIRVTSYSQLSVSALHVEELPFFFFFITQGFGPLLLLTCTFSSISVSKFTSDANDLNGTSETYAENTARCLPWISGRQRSVRIKSGWL